MEYNFQQFCEFYEKHQDEYDISYLDKTVLLVLGLVGEIGEYIDSVYHDQPDYSTLTELGDVLSYSCLIYKQLNGVWPEILDYHWKVELITLFFCGSVVAESYKKIIRDKGIISEHKLEDLKERANKNLNEIISIVHKILAKKNILPSTLYGVTIGKQELKIKQNILQNG